MNATVIDTLRYAERLKSVGIDGHHAEGMARALGDELAEGLPTRADLDAATRSVREDLDAAVRGIREDMDEGFRRFQAELAQETGQLRTEMNAGFASVQSRLAVLEQDVAALKGDRTVLQGATTALKDDNATFRSDISALKADVAQLKIDVAQLKADMAEVKSDIKVLYGSIRNIQHVLLLVVALGLYNAIAPHFFWRQSPPAAVPAPSLVAPEALIEARPAETESKTQDEPPPEAPEN